jgi:beta-ketoacyl-[acyl-carrier-protein] synthase III
MTLGSSAALLGLGVYRPARVVTNDEICQTIDSTSRWIETRSGIRTRRFAEPEENPVTMGIVAGRRALEVSGVAGAEIDCVIVATSTHTLHTPGAAPQIAHALGSTAAAFDISAGCAGFCHALAVAAELVKGGTARYVLVIGSELLSRFTDHHDRSTAFIFADGAGAVVVGASDQAGIGPVAWGSDGSQAGVISQHPRCENVTPDNPMVVRMEGNAVFRWAPYAMAKVALDALAAAGLGVDDLDAFIPHQANLRIIELLTRNIALPEHVAIARDVTDSGNTSAASIPLAMETMLRNGEAVPGATALILAFGAGLCFAGQVVSLPKF